MHNEAEIRFDSDDYELLVHVEGSLGMPGMAIGTRGRCRFCGETNPKSFKNVAHALPEAFGNKWVTSLDECDACNARFAVFDDALVKSMGAILTLGGTRGKRNKVRQTGRTNGPASIRHSTVDGRRSISVHTDVTSFAGHVGFNPHTGELLLRAPGGTERFVPARAYKALVKMAVSLLPLDELPLFTKIIEWLRGPDDSVLLPHMIVGLSFSVIGNTPPLLGAALLRRRSDCYRIPYMLFVTTMGSTCLQIVLKADDRDGPWPSPLKTRPNIPWTNSLALEGQESPELVYTYDPPVHLDWARSLLELPVIEAIITAVHLQTTHAHMSAVIRPSAIASPLS